MISLTPRQQELLDFIRAYAAEHGGLAPSLRVMQEHMRLASKSSVHKLLDLLEQRGRIRRCPLSGWQVIGEPAPSPVAPVYMGIDISGPGSDHTAVVYMRDRQIVDRAEVATCAVCGEAFCDHSDVAFAGLVGIPAAGAPR